MKKVQGIPPPLLKNKIPYHPWIYFLIFLASNTLLSYFTLPLMIRLWVGLLGLVLPFLLALWAVLEKPWKKPSSFSQVLSGPSPPGWLWFLFAALLLGTRFYQLTALPFWPIADEGIIGILGVNQSHQWQWNLLWTEVRLEPMIIWILGIYFRIFEPSFSTFRLFPAIVSIASALLAYWAARQYFSKSTSFVFCWFFTFSFWQFTLSRFCSPVILIPLFQTLCFAWLGIFLTTSGQTAKWKPLWILSCLAGVGFYTWTNWLSVWLSLTAILFIVLLLNQKKIKFFLITYGLVTILISIPLLLARLSAGGMSHIQSLISFSFLKPLFYYVNGLFWDGIISFPYGSNWGGLFNPILVSLIFTGVLYLLQTSKRNFILFGMTCIFFSLLPGALTKSVELYRIIPLFPFLMVLAAMGVNSLSPSPAKPWASLGIALLTLGSLGLDLYNYSARYSNIQKTPALRQWRTVEYWNAYQILKNQLEQTGPLYVFSEFNTDYDNKTLNIACYPFDVLQNRSLAKASPSWAAVIINSEYAPFLIQRFPGLKYKILRTDKNGPDDPAPFGIFLIPVSQLSEKDLASWIHADRFHRKLNLETKNKNPVESWKQFADSLAVQEESMEGDAFLEAVYWQKMAFFNFIARDFKKAAEFYQAAIQQGLPAVHLYYDLGISLKASGNITEGDKILEKTETISKEFGRPISGND